MGDLTKIESARRLIEAAIEATLNESDPLFVCTGAYTAFNCLVEFTRARGTNEWERVCSEVTQKKAFDRLLNEFPNFLKHSRVDYQRALEEPSPLYNDILIYLSMLILREMKEPLSIRMETFLFFFAIQHDEVKLRDANGEELYKILREVFSGSELNTRDDYIRVMKFGKSDIKITPKQNAKLLQLRAAILPGTESS